MRPATRANLEHDLDHAIALGDLDEATRLADQLDRMEPPDPVSLLSAAIWYAQQGLRVFCLQPGAKVPYSKSHGVDDATDDPRVVEQRWLDHPNANIGLATGHVFDVIDFDGYHAHASFDVAMRQRLNMPPVPDKLQIKPDDPDDPTRLAWADAKVEVRGTVSTPRPGGMHVYVPASGQGNAAGLFPGVDYRGLGGYVVAPPSVLDGRAGQVPGRYQWLQHPVFIGITDG